jgi:hypothetical protein
MPPEGPDERIAAAVEAIVHGVYDSGALHDPHRWWPRSYLPYSPLFAANFHARWVEQWRRIPREPATPYARGTAIWVLLAMASRSLKAMCEVQERCGIFLDLLEDIQAVTAGDIFCRDGAHRVLAQPEAQGLVDRLSFREAGERQSDRAYAVLNATLLAYSEAVFFSANCTVRDVHGPYEVDYRGQPCQLLVRDYYRLRDAQLEPGTAGVVPDSVRACSLYDSSVRFSFSVLNDYTSDRPLPGSIVAQAVEISPGEGGPPAGEISAVRQLTGELSEVITSVSAPIREADPQAQTLEILRRTYYRASPVAAAVGEDWEPDPEFVGELAGRLPGFTGSMPPPMPRDGFAAMVDPRV